MKRLEKCRLLIGALSSSAVSFFILAMLNHDAKLIFPGIAIFSVLGIILYNVVKSEKETE